MSTLAARSLFSVGTRFILVDAVRVRTSKGEASFANPFRERFAPVANDFNGEWMNFPAGTEFGVVATVERSDTFVLVVEADLNGPDANRGLENGRGLVLRTMAFNNLVGSASVIDEAPASEDEDAEVIEVAEASA